MREKGFTLIDVIVGGSLMVIVFAGIFGAYQLTSKVVYQSQHRIVSTAIANMYLERVRSLPYADVGVQEGGFPSGVFLAQGEETRNGTIYTVEIKVNYIVDAADGETLDDGDSCLNDYKRVLVTVSWPGSFPGSASLTTDVVPRNDFQECEKTGGLLRITVLDALGAVVLGANVDVEDKDPGGLGVTGVCVTPETGICDFILPPSLLGRGEYYKIKVTKSGYSSVETFRNGDIYQSQEIATPAQPHATILEGEIIERTFLIDRVGSLAIDTRSSRGRMEFIDPFDDLSKVDSSNNVEVVGGDVQLVQSGGAYVSSGYVISDTVTSGSLVGWGEAAFSSSTPSNTNLTIQVLYFNGSDWVAILDVDLPGNIAGFPTSSIDLSSLNISTYSQVRLRGDLITTDSSSTPSIDEWKVSYFTLNDFYLSSSSFDLHGAKIVGQDSSEKNIYKYSQSLVSGSSPSLILNSMEWDSYTFLVTAGGLSLHEIVPAPQPVAVDPAEAQSVALYIASSDNLLVRVVDFEDSTPVFSATVQLTKSGYDATQLTDSNGETLFFNIDPVLYSIDVMAEGYDSFNDPSISVSGDTTIIVTLTLNPE